MARLEPDCGLDLYEAARLLQLLYFVFEHAENPQDWFTMRAAIGSGLYAVERSVAAATGRYDAETGFSERTHR